MVSPARFLSRWLPRLPGRASLVGVDIGSNAVKAVELTRSAAGEVVARAGLQPVPPRSIANGSIVDITPVADALRSLLDAAGIRGRKVALSLPGSAVVAREISMQRMSPVELAGSIGWEAERHIPFALRDVNLDYQVVGQGTDADRRPTMVVLLAAARKSAIAEYAAVVAEASCVPAVVDVAAFALQNAYAAFGGGDGGSAALLNAGASTLNVNIARGGRSVFTRDMATGGNAYADVSRRSHSLSPGEAGELDMGGGDHGRTLEVPGPVAREDTESLLLEIEKTFDFFAATQAAVRIDRIVLSGGASREQEFSAAVAERFDAPVERFDPFRKMTLAGVSAAGGNLADVAAAAGVAAGLALRSMGDR